MRPGTPVRLVIVALVTIAIAAALIAVLLATDTILSIWQRLDAVAPWASGVYLLILVLLALSTGWFVLRLLTRDSKKNTMPELTRLDRDELEQRIEQLEEAGVSTGLARSELHELDQRHQSGHLYIALFGEISSGKSSLINALLPQAAQQTGVVGGTTTQAEYFKWQAPTGDSKITLVDLPGFSQSNGEDLGELARTEALRAHVVLYVCDGDLNRRQHAQLAALVELQKPLIVVLNKADRYDELELTELQSRLLDSVDATALAIMPVSSSGTETVTVIDSNGREHQQRRERLPQVHALTAKISELVNADRDQLVEQQQIGSLALAAAQITEAEHIYRRQAADTLVEKYSRRAVVGALAAIAPGSDLVIQGALATKFLHELCSLYGVAIKDVDLDQFLTLAGGKIRRTTALVLAVAGNGLKAFPGIGTVAGGLVHAVAYGMIFDSLGRAVASALAAREPFEPSAIAERFEEQLLGTMETRAGHYVRLALAQLRTKE